jgi:hypothetical protein
VPISPAPNIDDLSAHIISRVNLPEASLNTILKGRSNAVCPYSQSVDRYSLAIRQVFAVFDFGPFFLLIILQHQFAVFRRKLVHAVLEASISPFFFGCIGRGGQRRDGLSSQVLKVDLICHTIEISCALTSECRFNLFQLPGDPINRLIRKVFRFVATATREDLDKPSANFFVSLAGGFTIWVEPV